GVPEARGRASPVLCVAGRRQRKHLLHFAGGRRRHGPEGWLRQGRDRGQESQVGRTRGGDSGHCGQHLVHPNRATSLCFRREEVATSNRRCDMSAPKRISAEEVRSKLQSGHALLVCAYESDVKFRQAALDGAISFSEFEKRKASLPRDSEIIFY